MKLASGGSIVSRISVSPIPAASGMGVEKHVDSGRLASFPDTCPKQTSGNRIEIKKTEAIFLPELNIIIG